MTTSHRLAGKVALITGGARGIGRATAARLLAEGARVAVADRDPGALSEACLALGHADDVLAVSLDVSSADSARAAVEAVLARFGRLDVLVNNAGITRDATLAKTSAAAWDAVLAVNLGGTFHMTQAALPSMLAAGRGVILNAASVVGLHGNFGQSNYVASKAGVIGLTRVWARELGRKGIRVNCVAPGFIQTDMTAAMPPEALEQMKARTPLQRLGQPDDVAALYAFLASDDAAFIHGQVLGVDGGLVIGT